MFHEDGNRFGTQVVNSREWMEEQMVWMTVSPERIESQDLLLLRTSLGTATQKKVGLVPPRTADGASACRSQPVATSLALAGLPSQS